MTRIIVPLVAYLIGSIPFGYLIVRGKVGADIRETGSGGTGATNVSRRAGKLAGVVTLLLDALKGAAAVFFARAATGSEWIVADAAVAVIVGHIFPVWLRFRGGKGVATGAGVFAVLAPVSVLSAGIVFLTTVVRTRYVSLGSMLGASMIPLSIWVLKDSRPLLIAAVLGALLIVFAHRGNIERLARGTEAKI